VVRANGGVCIIDEVQSGMGRVGNYFFDKNRKN
jgi:4-aminobutyrate aminotransferase-like enzyme